NGKKESFVEAKSLSMAVELAEEKGYTIAEELYIDTNDYYGITSDGKSIIISKTKNISTESSTRYASLNLENAFVYNFLYKDGNSKKYYRIIEENSELAFNKFFEYIKVNKSFTEDEDVLEFINKNLITRTISSSVKDSLNVKLSDIP